MLINGSAVLSIAAAEAAATTILISPSIIHERIFNY